MREVLVELLAREGVRTTGVVELELGVTARSAQDYEGLRRRWSVLPRLELDDAGVRRAQDVQQELVARGHHRGVGLPDLLVAAVAEAAGAEVLHYDHDFDLVSEVTGQPVRWVVDRGSVD